MARRFGSAMISNTDSTLFVYSKEHIRVKVYLQAGGPGFSRGNTIIHKNQAARRLTDSLALMPAYSLHKETSMGKEWTPEFRRRDRIKHAGDDR
jgi:hypothetical protein